MIQFFKKFGLRDFLFIICGTFLMAASVNFVYDPMGMVTGGVTGLGIVIKELTKGMLGTGYFADGIPVWITNLVLNIPLFVGALLIKGKKFIGRTFFSTVMLTFFIYLLPIKSIFHADYLLYAVFGGALGGIGIGLVLAARSTTGGTDMLCALLQTKFKHYTVPQLLVAVDGIIVLLGVVVFGINDSLYAGIAIFITSKVSDSILEGLKFSKVAYIISSKYKEIADEILVKMDRGVTGIAVKGMYSNEDKNMLFCVVSKKEIAEVIDIVNKEDKSAFVIVSDAREVMGEGFIQIQQ